MSSESETVRYLTGVISMLRAAAGDVPALEPVLGALEGLTVDDQILSCPGASYVCAQIEDILSSHVASGAPVGGVELELAVSALKSIQFNLIARHSGERVEASPRPSAFIGKLNNLITAE